MNKNSLPLLGASVATVIVGAISTLLALPEQARQAATFLFILAAATTITLAVRTSARNLYRVIHRIERTAIANHKRASVWNSQLKEQLDAAGFRHASEPARRGAGHPGERLNQFQTRQSELLVESAILDLEFYSAVSDNAFADEMEAAEHFLRSGAASGLPLTPLLDVGKVPATVADPLKRGDVRPLLSFLRSAEAFEGDLSPLFAAEACGITRRAARLHVGGVIGAYQERSRTQTCRDVFDKQVRQARTDLINHARGVHTSAKLAGRRDQLIWDEDAERIWLKTVLDLNIDLPFASVIMPVKDRAHSIVSAIASVQAQTHTSWELIVVDDGSKDATRKLVRDLANLDSRIRLVDNAGSGVSAARNIGLELASGKYIAFLDSDNEWVEHFLSASISAMSRGGIDAAYAAVSAESGGETRYRAFEGGLEHLMVLNHIDLNVFVVRRELIDAGVRFDEELKRWVDHDFAIKIANRTTPRLLPFLGCKYDDSEASTDRITVRESEHWQWAVLGRHWVDWNDVPQSIDNRLSVVVPTYNDSEMTISAVRSVLSDADSSKIDVEILVIDNGSRLAFGQEIIATFASNANVRYHRLPRNLNFAIGCNFGAAASAGDNILFLNNDTIVRKGALSELLIALDSPGTIGVQPLLLYPDDTIQTAGTYFPTKNSLPAHLLTGHPPADSSGLRHAEFDAVTGAALMMRSRHVRQMGGFDPIFVNGMEDVDFCLRAKARIGGQFSVVPSAIVTHAESRTPGRGANVDENRRIFRMRWDGLVPGPQDELIRRTGFAVAHVGTDGRQVPGPRVLVVRDPGDCRLRWGIRIASVPGERGDLWGDTHFGESLRAALIENGQSAVVHRHGSHASPASAFDDVNLVIRGLDRARPIPGKINLLWIISHPDKVSVQEMREFDHVFAASASWASRTSAATGVAIEPLLQATDKTRFNTLAGRDDLGMPIFVGGVHPGRERAIVGAASQVDLRIAVYGPGWEGLVGPGILRGSYIDNAVLARAYRGATVVLADHWTNMASQGFIQNRVFDAVSAGCRVISDPVHGIEELFLGAVRTYSSPQHLKFLCDNFEVEFPDDSSMDAIASRVQVEHSFDARARTLVEVARQLLNSPGTEGR